MKLLKSKKGFTLIELLVVIGILAVLAAIAIPSVAGLIDRANVSADKTNANEMTNAIERFTSEYEIVRQDLMSGLITDVNNLDGAQGRVHYVTQVTTPGQIKDLEKDANVGPNTTGRAIYRDTKYPVNAETMQAIVEAYTKTSSATFEPKQSDMHYWYSPDCGVVVFAKPNADVVADLNKQVQSGVDAKGKPLDGNTKWIDITDASVSEGADATESLIHNVVVPSGGLYTSNGVQYSGGENFPAPADGDKYVYGDYRYTYYEAIHQWEACVIDKTKTNYGNLLETVNGMSLGSIDGTFTDCVNMVTAPQIPSTVVEMSCAFFNCKSLTVAPVIPQCAENMTDAFYGCVSLQSKPAIPASVWTPEADIFTGCTQFGY